MPSSEGPTRSDAAPIAASAGIDTRDRIPARDPWIAFDQLMELVEALLPEGPRPQRPPTTGRFVL